MTDYTNLLRMLKTYEDGYGLYQDAAAAIEALEAEIRESMQKCAECGAEPITLEQAIDRLHELGWLQEHDRILSQPHWVSVEEPPKGNGAFAACCVYDGKIYWFKAIFLDGKWLREMDGVELPVNYWMEIPEPPKEVQDGTE